MCALALAFILRVGRTSLQKHVGWLDVTMDNAMLVSMVNSVSGVCHQKGSFRSPDASLTQDFSHSHAVHELGHDEWELTALTDFEDGHNSRMVQRGHVAGFPLKPLSVFVCHERSAAWHLDGDDPMELRILRSIDRTESAATDDFQ
jgi:hypothetical protein